MLTSHALRLLKRTQGTVRCPLSELRQLHDLVDKKASDAELEVHVCKTSHDDDDDDDDVPKIADMVHDAGNLDEPKTMEVVDASSSDEIVISDASMHDDEDLSWVAPCAKVLEAHTALPPPPAEQARRQRRSSGTASTASRKSKEVSAKAVAMPKAAETAQAKAKARASKARAVVGDIVVRSLTER